jgi:anti-anti-sigma factor
MEITPIPHEDRHELRLKGRLDANWADHVSRAIESAVRAGQHHIDLEFSQVTYISSAGIRLLLKYFKQLKAVQGRLRVVQPTEGVLAVLRLSGISGMLVDTAEDVQSARAPAPARRWEKTGVIFEAHEQAPGRILEGRLIGYPEKFAAGSLTEKDSERIRFATDCFGIGLGAFGNESIDSADRFGEFLAAGGAAVTQPTDDSSVPDFQIAEGQLLPEVSVLYGLIGRGVFSHLLRFEASSGERGVITLADLIEAGLEELHTPVAAFVLAAETASLVGATLRKSPVSANAQSPWSFPGVRDWLSFTTERSDERNVALIVGIAQREPAPGNVAFLRPIGPGTNAHGHFHAATFPYRPLPKGNIILPETVTNLLGTESARTVLHLLADERRFEGVGQTDLMRGACWTGPLQLSGPSPVSSTTP